jgi:hypothetical protein
VWGAVVAAAVVAAAVVGAAVVGAAVVCGTGSAKISTASNAPGPSED